MRKFITSSVLVVSLLTMSEFALARSEYSGLSTAEIDQLVSRTMEKFNIPGVAVGIIKDGKVIHSKGYGIRHLGKKETVNEETLFSIASTGKSFTAAALALLVDSGKITWEDKVIDHLPDFRLYDPWVTREFMVKDLLIHNSGLGLGAGDLMFFPSQGFSRAEIITNLRHLKPVSSFRSEFAYDNLLYLVAGEVVAAVSGKSYEDFVDQNILQPLGMKNCAANITGLKKHKNIADPHMLTDGVLAATERDVRLGEQSIFAAAGGIQCSIKSILKWHDMHLQNGKMPNGDVFMSEEQQAELMTPQTITSVRETNKEWFNSSFSAYGLGWGLSDYNGYKLEQHGGGLLGMLSHNAMIPELGLGVAVYINQHALYANAVITNQILEAYTSDKRTDWLSKFTEIMEQRLARGAKAVPDLTQSDYSPVGSIERYAGTYKDPWFGKVTITSSKEGLYFKAARSLRLKGKMVPYKSDLFIVQWDDRTLDADAYVKFTTDYDGTPKGITMKAVSPLTDFSFDFHDLDFTKVTMPEQDKR
ncbi:MAG: serine hydrolase [Emcibacter sp.]|nr:serine hydrolase [Emcibacter sp.]